MGLDNGICVERNDFTNSLFELEKFKYEYAPRRYFEICYWRKCWNIRDAIGRKIWYEDNGYSNELTEADLYNIIEALESFNEEKWNEDFENGETIWEWDIIEQRLAQQIQDLKLLIDLKKKYENKLYIYFYDSY